MQPLTPGVPVELDVEIWPTSIVVSVGYRIGFTVRGKDYEYDGTDAGVAHAPYPMKGVGPFTHTLDRPKSIFGGKNTLHFAAGKMPYVLLPVIPGSDGRCGDEGTALVATAMINHPDPAPSVFPQPKL